MHHKCLYPTCTRPSQTPLGLCTTHATNPTPPPTTTEKLTTIRNTLTALHQQGQSLRAIGRTTGIDKATVARILDPTTTTLRHTTWVKVTHTLATKEYEARHA